MYVEKNSSPTSARDKATIEYISGRQPSVNNSLISAPNCPK